MPVFDNPVLDTLSLRTWQHNKLKPQLTKDAHHASTSTADTGNRHMQWTHRASGHGSKTSQSRSLQRSHTTPQWAQKTPKIGACNGHIEPQDMAAQQAKAQHDSTHNRIAQHTSTTIGCTRPQWTWRTQAMGTGNGHMKLERWQHNKLKPQLTKDTHQVSMDRRRNRTLAHAMDTSSLRTWQHKKL
eukprot:1148728-Pelagomonas_calceolata.AAC.1